MSESKNFLEKIPSLEINGYQSDQFPIGMQVLAIDANIVCLTYLVTLLRKCQYQGFFFFLMVSFCTFNFFTIFLNHIFYFIFLIKGKCLSTTLFFVCFYRFNRGFELYLLYYSRKTWMPLVFEHLKCLHKFKFFMQLRRQLKQQKLLRYWEQRKNSILFSLM